MFLRIPSRPAPFLATFPSYRLSQDVRPGSSVIFLPSTIKPTDLLVQFFNPVFQFIFPETTSAHQTSPSFLSIGGRCLTPPPPDTHESLAPLLGMMGPNFFDIKPFFADCAPDLRQRVVSTLGLRCSLFNLHLTRGDLPHLSE